VSSVGAALNPIRTQGSCRGQSDPARQARKRVLQPPVAPFHHTIRLGVEGGGRLVLDAQLCSHRASQMAKVNCVPRSEVSRAGTPYLEIQPALRVSAQVAAAMSRMGSASSQREDLSTTVNRARIFKRL
jgi:hypothetical protein